MFVKEMEWAHAHAVVTKRKVREMYANELRALSEDFNTKIRAFLDDLHTTGFSSYVDYTTAVAEGYVKKVSAHVEAERALLKVEAAEADLARRVTVTAREIEDEMTGRPARQKSLRRGFMSMSRRSHPSDLAGLSFL